MENLATDIPVRNVALRTMDGVQAMLLDYEHGDVPGVNKCPPMFEELPKALHLLQVGQGEIQSLCFNAYRMDESGEYVFTGETAVLVNLEGIGWDWDDETFTFNHRVLWTETDRFQDLDEFRARQSEG